MVADDDIRPLESPDPEDAVLEVLLRIPAEEGNGRVADPPVPGKPEARKNRRDRFGGIDGSESTCRVCPCEETFHRLLIDLVERVRPGDTVPLNALLEVLPELIGEHLAGRVTDGV